MNTNEMNDDGFQGHICRPELSHQGYRHAAAVCYEDKQSRLWVGDANGRNHTQVKFCPFCGFQALNDTKAKGVLRLTEVDIALCPKDTPMRQWVQYTQVIKMRHFQFGTVRVLASDGCHAKVVTDGKVQVTVCVENLEKMSEGVVPLFAKVEKEKKKTEAKERKEKVDQELLQKYLSM